MSQAPFFQTTKKPDHLTELWCI